MQNNGNCYIDNNIIIIQKTVLVFAFRQRSWDAKRSIFEQKIFGDFLHFASFPSVVGRSRAGGRPIPIPYQAE